MMKTQNLTFIEKRQYMCDICEKNFNTEHKLKRHFNAIHNTRLMTKSHQCNICSRSFSRVDSWRKHIHTIHEGHKDHKCEYCGKSFSQA